MKTRFAHLRSESGVVAPGTLIGILLVAVIVYIALAVTDADTAHFGAVPVPGTAAISLDKGETEIYYSQTTNAQSPFSKPDDLGILIRDSAGTLVEPDYRGDKEKETEEGLTQLVAAASIPAESVYTVEVTGSPAAGALKPEVTFGQGPIEAMTARVKEIDEQLLGPVGVLLLVVLAALYLIPRLQRKNTKTTHYNEF